MGPGTGADPTPVKLVDILYIDISYMIYNIIHLQAKFNTILITYIKKASPLSELAQLQLDQSSI